MMIRDNNHTMIETILFCMLSLSVCVCIYGGGGVLRSVLSEN